MSATRAEHLPVATTLSPLRARVAAAIAGASAVALGIATLSGPSVPDEHWATRGSLVNALGLVTFAALVAASGLLVPLLSLGRPGVVGVRAAEVGLSLMTVESVASQVHGGNTLGPVFGLGLLLTLVGFLAVCVDGLRKAQGRWLAPLPLVAMLVGIGAGDRGGFMLLGVAWWGLALGAAMDARDTVRAAGRP